MRVVLNGLAALKPRTGVGNYVAELAARLPLVDPHTELAVYPGKWLSAQARKILQRPKKTGAGGSQSPAGHTWKQRLKSWARKTCEWHFGGYCRLHRAQLYHEPNFIPFRVGKPTIITVHDLSVIFYPEWHPTDRVALHQKQFEEGIERADHVIVVSQAVRDELIRHFGLNDNRVTAIYNGVNERYRPQPPEEVQRVRQQHDLPENYFLCVGTIEPRKNLTTVMRAFVELPSSVRQRCPLVLVGPWGWKAEQEKQYFEGVAQPAGARKLGYVSDDDLPGLYCGATALLYPSHYEGFGLPPVEMLACGGNVIGSQADAVREVVGDQGILLPAEDQAAWQRAMLEAATEPDYFSEACQTESSVNGRYSWEQCAKETYAVYNHVLDLPISPVRSPVIKQTIKQSG